MRVQVSHWAPSHFLQSRFWCGRSSAGQSLGLWSRWSWIRIPPVTPKTIHAYTSRTRFAVALLVELADIAGLKIQRRKASRFEAGREHHPLIPNPSRPVAQRQSSALTQRRSTFRNRPGLPITHCSFGRLHLPALLFVASIAQLDRAAISYIAGHTFESCSTHHHFHPAIAQTDRAAVSDAAGRTFESY